jgi:hypothetical protein
VRIWNAFSRIARGYVGDEKIFDTCESEAVENILMDTERSLQNKDEEEEDP